MGIEIDRIGFEAEDYQAFAQRLEEENKSSRERQVERAYQLAFGRAPQKTETAEARAFIEGHGLQQFARAILNANEFVFIP